MKKTLIAPSLGLSAAAVCALYLPNSGHTPDQLKDGIVATKPDDMGKAMLEPQRKILTF